MGGGGGGAYLNYTSLYCVFFSFLLLLTFASPNNLRVGSNPTENISLKIVDPTNVLIPDGRGNVTIMANDTSMASHTSTDRRPSSSTSEENGTIKVSRVR